MTDSPADPVLERIAEYRRAARLAVTSDAEDRRRCLALLELGDAARGEADPVVATWAERAIWEEAKSFLGVDDELPAPPPTTYESAQRRLRVEGYSRCPTCFSEVATEADLERWAAQRKRRTEELERRERAVEAQP